MVTVRVVEIREGYGRTARKRIIAVNEATGRKLNVSPQRLRRPQGCEFCRQGFNRPAPPFTCPYCNTEWN